MNEIEKLVKALRCCADTSTMECSPDCPRYAPEEYCGYRVREEAANLIEKLIARCVRYAEEIAVLQERKTTQTNADRLRTMSDEELAAEILKRWRAEMSNGGEDLSVKWCDLHGGCVGKDGRELACNEKRLLGCVLRWLQSPAESTR